MQRGGGCAGEQRPERPDRHDQRAVLDEDPLHVFFHEAQETASVILASDAEPVAAEDVSAVIDDGASCGVSLTTGVVRTCKLAV